MEAKKLSHPLQVCLEHWNSQPSVKQAMSAIHTCMVHIQQKIDTYKQTQCELERTKPWRVDRKTAVVNLVFAELINEHPTLFIAFERPTVPAIWDVLPKETCTTRRCSCCAHKRASMLDFELLEKAAKADSAGMAAISNWLEKRVADFCRLTDPQGSQEEPHGIEHFALSPDGKKLMVTPEWLCFLQSNHTSGSNKQSAGPVLDWLYDSKHTVPAKVALPGATKPPASQACDDLVASVTAAEQSAVRPGRVEGALEALLQARHQMRQWEGRINNSQELPTEGF